MQSYTEEDAMFDEYLDALAEPKGDTLPDHILKIRKARAADQGLTLAQWQQEEIRKARDPLYGGGMDREYCGWPTFPPRSANA